MKKGRGMKDEQWFLLTNRFAPFRHPRFPAAGTVTEMLTKAFGSVAAAEIAWEANRAELLTEIRRDPANRDRPPLGVQLFEPGGRDGWTYPIHWEEP